MNVGNMINKLVNDRKISDGVEEEKLQQHDNINEFVR